MAQIRLDKYLADSGCGTRSQVKAIVKQGRISVNNEIIKKSDIKIDLEKDVVLIDGTAVNFEEYSYYMLNKPCGVVSATTDTKDKTVIELIDEAKRRDLFPVGRLDKDTEGLLLITNDGKLANDLLAPGKHVAKKYYAKIDGVVNDETVKLFEDGVDIGDEKLTAPAKLEIISTDEANKNSEIIIEITEGRYHQIKRMFEAVSMKVTYLKRLSMGSLSLDEKIPCGEYRRLTAEEIEALKRETKKKEKVE